MTRFQLLDKLRLSLNLASPTARVRIIKDVAHTVGYPEIREIKQYDHPRINRRTKLIKKFIENLPADWAPPPPEEPTDADLLTRREVAALLKVTTRTIANYVKSERLTPVAYSQRTVRFRRSEVMQLTGKVGA